MKRFVFLLVGMAISFNTIAEDYEAFKFGLRFNPNIGWLAAQAEIRDQDASVENDGVELGFSWGVDVNYRFADNYAIASELRITHLRGNVKLRDNEPDAPSGLIEDFHFNFIYVDLPVGLKLQTNQIGYFNFFGRFSGIPGINVNRRGDIGDAEDLSLSDDVRFFRIAAEVAIGAHYQIAGNTYLKGSIAYNTGVSNFMQNNPDEETLEHFKEEYDIALRNNYFALNLGVMF